MSPSIPSQHLFVLHVQVELEGVRVVMMVALGRCWAVKVAVEVIRVVAGVLKVAINKMV